MAMGDHFSFLEPDCPLPASYHDRHPTTTIAFLMCQQLQSLAFGIALPILLVGLVISVYVTYKRRQTRRELEGGMCNLPTKYWKPRFMNYTAQEDEDRGASDDEDGVIWESGEEDIVMEWARKFLVEHSSSTTATPAPSDGKKKMGSSSITNILPRMERLRGPYGIYATVYGIQTKVVHVAHPVPARAILTGAGAFEIGGMGDSIKGGFENNNDQFRFSLQKLLQILSKWGSNHTTTSGSAFSKNNKKNNPKLLRKSSSLRMLTGSTKNPAYDHFKNFSGEGVFTANGPDWKAKRASVLHCLIRAGGDTEKSLEVEANIAADSFEREVAHAAFFERSTTPSQHPNRRNDNNNNNNNNKNGERKSPVMNVVPMLQRSTIGLIYRLITHQTVDFSPDWIGRRDVVETTARAERDDPTSYQSESLTSSSSSTSLASMGEDTNDNNEALAHDTTPTKHPTTSSSEGCCREQRSQHNNEQEAQIKSLLPTYLDSVTKIRMIVLAQSRSFWYLLPRWVYKAFSPMYREEERTMGPIREFARLTCESALPGSPLALLSQRSSHSSSPDERRSAEDGTTTTLERKNNTRLSNNVVSKDLLDEAITLLFAGQDTSAATLSWTLHLLSLHPDKQETVANEVRSILLGASDTKSVTKGMISRMPYMDAVIKESMRLYPVAPFIVRKLTTDITIPKERDDSPHSQSHNNDSSSANNNKTLSIPASTFACIWIYALHRNPKLWDRPDDFLPERWIDPALRRRDSGQEEYGAYMPFAIGPRNCLGQPLAQVVLRIMLARILNKYVVLDPKLEAVRKVMLGDTNVDEEGKEEEVVEFDSKCLRKDMQAGFTVLPSNGLKLRLMERRQ